MSSAHPSVRLHPDVVDTTIDDGDVALLHLESKTYFSLNRTGALIWAHLKQGLDVGEVSKRLQEEFDVDAANAQQSVLRLVDELVEHKLVIRD